MKIFSYDWNQALAALRAAEPGLAALFERFPHEYIRGSGQAFQVVANAVIGQQISVPAAAAIFGRLSRRLGEWRPEALLACRDEDLRADGLSRGKVATLRSLAAALRDGSLRPETWPRCSDDEVRASLTALRGIGPWTADMVLIFYLQRPDVLPLGDIGLLRSAARVFGWSYPYDPRVLGARAEAWRPWRTVATWYLWRDLDPLPVVY